MPNIMIHEEVGNFISKKIGINSYNYYLGILAPDAPNTDCFAEKDERWTAHLRKKDLKDWRNSLKEFYNREKDNYPKDFLIGYYIHVLTDIIYDDFLYLNVRNKILKDNYKLEDAHQIMLNDMNDYSFEGISIIKNILNDSDLSYSVQNIDKKLLGRWKIKQINSFSLKNTSKYITEDVIKELNELVYKEFEELNI